jgi:phosphoglycolate phosphatase
LKQYNYFLFDLDGTITDPAEGITNSVAYALQKYDIEVKDKTELHRFIGQPLLDSFSKYYGFYSQESQKAVDYYREYYRDKGILENKVYDGLEDILKRLQCDGKTLVVATSKPEVFARQILDHFGLSKYFMYIAGSNLDGTRTNKAEVIEYALKSCDIKSKDDVIMIGDRKYDIVGANKTGLDSIGVLFGYGNKDEFIDLGAVYIVETVWELYNLVV